ncbi:MAG: MarR family transcriptional regulator [Rhizomicrobium sp.]
MTMGLTPRQADCLAVIERVLAERGIAPSFDEIAAHMGLQSKSNVDRLLKALEERGFIRRMPYRARGIELVARLCPHCGNIAGSIACQVSATRSAALLKDAIERRLIAASPEIPDNNSGSRPPWSAGARDAAPKTNPVASLAQSKRSAP